VNYDSAGSWDVNRGLSMRWTEGDIWEASLPDVPAGTEFKLVVVSGAGQGIPLDSVWEPCSNRVVDGPEGQMSLVFGEETDRGATTWAGAAVPPGAGTLPLVLSSSDGARPAPPAANPALPEVLSSGSDRQRAAAASAPGAPPRAGYAVVHYPEGAEPADSVDDDTPDVLAFTADALDISAPQAPVAEAPVAEAPVAEAPVAEVPVAEAPVAEAPVAEAPVAPRKISMLDQAMALIEAIDEDTADEDEILGNEPILAALGLRSPEPRELTAEDVAREQAALEAALRELDELESELEEEAAALQAEGEGEGEGRAPPGFDSAEAEGKVAAAAAAGAPPPPAPVLSSGDGGRATPAAPLLEEIDALVELRRQEGAQERSPTVPPRPSAVAPPEPSAVAPPKASAVAPAKPSPVAPPKASAVAPAQAPRGTKKARRGRKGRGAGARPPALKTRPEDQVSFNAAELVSATWDDALVRWGLLKRD